MWRYRRENLTEGWMAETNVGGKTPNETLMEVGEGALDIRNTRRELRMPILPKYIMFEWNMSLLDS